MRSASTNFANRSYISVPVRLGGIQALALCSWGNSACLIALLNRITKKSAATFRLWRHTILAALPKQLMSTHPSHG